MTWHANCRSYDSKLAYNHLVPCVIVNYTVAICLGRAMICHPLS